MVGIVHTMYQNGVSPGSRSSLSLTQQQLPSIPISKLFVYRSQTRWSRSANSTPRGHYLWGSHLLARSVVSNADLPLLVLALIILYLKQFDRKSPSRRPQHSLKKPLLVIQNSNECRGIINAQVRGGELQRGPVDQHMCKMLGLLLYARH